MPLRLLLLILVLAACSPRSVPEPSSSTAVILMVEARRKRLFPWTSDVNSRVWNGRKKKD
ncbi:MAG TPA: hypothetical protein VM557_10350 [Thermoanaerobaculia bacterium]|nr:hypothetical protein [Thermoanaerobaculia bacterium]